MLAVNRALNPEAEHRVGDMTTLELGREFDRVLIHDAIMYATTPESVQATLRTAARHCRSGGLVVVVPDFLRETFAPETSHDGHDAPDGRALRYLAWTWDPNPADCTVDTVYAFVLREPDGRITTIEDRHREGCFAHSDCLRWFDEAGFDTRIHHDPWDRDVFIARRRAPQSR